MKSNEREHIINPIKLFKEMYDIIVSNPNNDINYGKRTIKNIVQYLEAELTNDPLRYEELVSEVRYTSNHEYEQIKSQIETILSKYI